MMHKHVKNRELDISKDFIFLPTLKVTLMNAENIDQFRKRFFDITSDGKFDIENLKPYIYIALNMQSKKAKV